MALATIKKQTQNLCKSLSSVKPINPHCKNLSTNCTSITNDLISIFIKHEHFPADSLKLKTLAPLIDTSVVESVLTSFKSWRKAHSFFNWASNQYGYKHNMYTYNAMASILSRARQNAPLKALAADILNSRCVMTPGALGFFIRCLGNVGLAYEANVLFDQVKLMGLCVHNSYSYNCLFEAFSSSSSVYIYLVEMRLKEMRDQGLSLSQYTLTPVLRFYCNAGKFNEALIVFNEIHDHGWMDAYVFSILVLSFSKWGQVDKAFEFIERMEEQNFRLNEKTVRNLIHGFVKESRVDKGLKLFYKMQQYGFSPDISLYDVLIGGLCSGKELDKALSLYSEMKMLKIQPDVGVIGKLISSFPEEKNLIRILEECFEDMDVKTRTMLCNSLLSCLVTNGLTDKACCLLRTMIGKGNDDSFQYKQLFRNNETVPPNTASFSIVINGMVQASKLDVALSFFRDMAEIGCDRDLPLYNTLIDGLCNSDRLDESYEILKEMEELGFKPTQFTLNSIFGCLCKRADVSGALDVVKKMRQYGHEPWVKYYTLLVRKLCKNWKTAEACIFLTDMVQEGFPPDIIAYSALLSGLIDIQDVEQAMKLFRDICARGHCPDVVAYNILIKGLCETHRIAEAQNLFDEMVIKGLAPSIVSYNSLIDGWCKSGFIDDAMSCFSNMPSKGRKPNVVTYTTLINGLCRTGKPDEAVMLWNEMRRTGCAPNRISFMNLIYGLCKCDKPETALIYFHEMEKKEMEPEAFVYIALITAFVSNSNLPKAFEILEEMVGRRTFPDPHDKNCVVIRDAILKLTEDARTSSSVKFLIVNGSIPKCLLDSGDKGDV